MSSTKPLLWVLSAAVLLAAGACREPEVPLGSGGGYMPGTPGGSGGKSDGGSAGPDGGGVLGRACTSSTGCAGACPDGGTVCVGNCGFLAPVEYASPTPGGVTGLAAADVDGDGHDDLLTVGTQDDVVALLLNRGDGTFDSHVLVPVLRPGALHVEDLDGDGKKDLAVLSGSRGVLDVLLGKGDGTFETPVSVPVGSGASELVVARRAGSGVGDLALLRPDHDELVLMRGTGGGSFQVSSRLSLPASSSALAAADLTLDGRMDLITTYQAACNWQTEVCEEVGVLPGNGDGTFQTQRFSPAGAAPRGLVVGELNYDARPDLVVANGASDGGVNGSVSVLLGLGDGTFRAPVSYPAGGNPGQLALADIDRDDLSDLLAVNHGENRLSLYLGRQDGSFSPPVFLQAAPLTGQRLARMAVADFDGDGQEDLAVTSGNFLHLLWGTCR